MPADPTPAAPDQAEGPQPGKITLLDALTEAINSLPRYYVTADGYMTEHPEGQYVEHMRLPWAITHALGRAGELPPPRSADPLKSPPGY